jgi:hypothetical protein
MRRLWFTILLAVSIAFGGVASAWAAKDCPYKAVPAQAHDCCPEGAMAGMQQRSGGDHDSKKAADCQLGQACRASSAVVPSLPMLMQIAAKPVAIVPVLVDAQSPPVVLFAFWRPPRTV